MVRLLPSVTKVDRLFSSTRPRARLFTQRNETTMRRRGTIRLGLTALAAASALLVLPQMAQAAPSEEEIAAAQAAEEAGEKIEPFAEIEVKLAEVNASAATATQNAQMAGEDLQRGQARPG